MKLLVLGGWNLETWASTTLMHMYDFLYGMVGAFGRRERGGGGCLRLSWSAAAGAEHGFMVVVGCRERGGAARGGGGG
jgi:hypothetical protein